MAAQKLSENSIWTGPTKPEREREREQRLPGHKSRDCRAHIRAAGQGRGAGPRGVQRQLCANVATAAHKSIRLIRKIAKYAGKLSRQWQLQLQCTQQRGKEEQGIRGTAAAGPWLVGYVAQSSLTDMVNSAA